MLFQLTDAATAAHGSQGLWLALAYSPPRHKGSLAGSRGVGLTLPTSSSSLALNMWSQSLSVNLGFPILRRKTHTNIEKWSLASSLLSEFSVIYGNKEIINVAHSEWQVIPKSDEVQDAFAFVNKKKNLSSSRV